jgi:hypothetical protein
MNHSERSASGKLGDQPAREIVGMREAVGESIFMNVCPAAEADARAVWFPSLPVGRAKDSSNEEYQTLAILDTEPYLKFGRLAVESIAVKHHADKDHLLLEVQRKSGQTQLLSLAYTEKGNLILIAYEATPDSKFVFDTEEIGEITLD